ncbi:MAG: hypothetical protein IPI72_12240 [Flavobacteriales bacterium]|nr:hypothetical protein [Flavobacteriales bacterium]
MAYPDGEVVKYDYNTAGKVTRVHSTKSNFDYEVVANIGYDVFEQRVYMKHGNNVETRYTYEDQRRRLSTLKVRTPGGEQLMDNLYGYDLVNNVVSLANTRPPGTGQGGQMNSTYGYDVLYRLTSATGNYTGTGRVDGYTLGMEYDNLHNIVRKHQTHTSSFPTAELSNHDNEYTYEGIAPHTPDRVGGREYFYDRNGNLMGWEEDAPSLSNRHISWDEENRMTSVNDDGYVSKFTYDAGGERVLKSHGGMQGVFINGTPVGLVNHRNNFTIYVSPYLVHGDMGFTKHYFIEGQRVASRTGTGSFYIGPLRPNGITAGELDYRERIALMQGVANQHMTNVAPVPGLPTLPNYNGQPSVSGRPIYLGDIGQYGAPQPGSGWPLPPLATGATPGPPTMSFPNVTNATVQAGYGYQNESNQPELNRFFHHPDHLGSASYITDILGNARQHVEYMPYGESFVDEHSTADLQPYLFNGKEQDAVTGLYYYGARYYDPVAAMWASLDPMANAYPDVSPFAYCINSPVVARDEQGEWVNFVVGAAIGGLSEYAIQVASNLSEGKGIGASLSDVDGGAILMSAGTGLLGAGVASGVVKLGKAVKAVNSLVASESLIGKAVGGAINVTSDVVSGATVNAVTGKEISVESVAIDVLGGLAGRQAKGAIKGKYQNSAEATMLHKEAARDARINSNNPKPSRAARAEASQQTANEFGDTRAVVGGKVTSKATKELLKAATNED